MHKRLQALGRLKPGAMNKTETAYSTTLEIEKRAGAVLWYKFEGMKFRLADNTFYTPDFIVLLADGTMQAREVKGFWTDDSRAKIKIAADMYPIEFVAIQAQSRKEGGGWKVEAF